MSIWTAINPWGEIDDLKKQIEQLSEELIYISNENHRLHGRATASERELNTTTLRAKMQKEEIMRLNDRIKNMQPKQKREPNGRYAKPPRVEEK